MSNWDTSIDTFTTKTDGVDTAMAADVNKLQDSVVAIQTHLGTDTAGSFTTLKDSVDARVLKSGDSMTGDLDFGGTHTASNLPPPMNGGDAAPRSYVDISMSAEAFRFRDDFAGSKSASWTLAGTGGSYVQNAAIGGTGDLSTGGTTSNEALLTFNGNGVTDKTKAFQVNTFVAISATTQINAVVAGLWADINNSISIYYDVTSSAGNFKYRCRSGGTETVTDSGVAADTSLHLFTIQVSPDGATVTFQIDKGHNANVTTNITSSLLEPQLSVTTHENADKRLTVDYYDLVSNR